MISMKKKYLYKSGSYSIVLQKNNTDFCSAWYHNNAQRDDTRVESWILIILESAYYTFRSPWLIWFGSNDLLFKFIGVCCLVSFPCFVGVVYFHAFVKVFVESTAWPHHHQTFFFGTFRKCFNVWGTVNLKRFPLKFSSHLMLRKITKWQSWVPACILPLSFRLRRHANSIILWGHCIVTVVSWNEKLEDILCKW